MSTSDTDTSGLRELSEAATPGRWLFGGGSALWTQDAVIVPNDVSLPDAAFIAACVNHVRAALAAPPADTSGLRAAIFDALTFMDVGCGFWCNERRGICNTIRANAADVAADAVVAALAAAPAPEGPRCSGCGHAPHGGWCPKMMRDGTCACDVQTLAPVDPPAPGTDEGPGETLPDGHRIVPCVRTLSGRYVGCTVPPGKEHWHSADEEGRDYVHEGPKPRRPAAAPAPGLARQALQDAADAVRDVRENGLPEGVTGHPSSEGFEDWLRARAASLAGDDGQDTDERAQR